MNRKESYTNKRDMTKAYIFRILGALLLIGAGSLAILGTLFLKGVGLSISTSLGIGIYGLAIISALLGNYLGYLGVIKQAIAEGIIDIADLPPEALPQTVMDKERLRWEKEDEFEDDVEEDIQQDLQQEKLSYPKEEGIIRKRGRPRKIKEVV